MLKAMVIPERHLCERQQEQCSSWAFWSVLFKEQLHLRATVVYTEILVKTFWACNGVLRFIRH